MTCDHIWIEGAEGAFAGLTHHCPKCGEETTRPPDRLSADMWDGPRIRVWLDGVQQKHVFAYDTILGTVERCKLDADGGVYAVGDEIATETVTGVVRVEWVE